jgi:hypothetical protein
VDERCVIGEPQARYIDSYMKINAGWRVVSARLTRVSAS